MQKWEYHAESYQLGYKGGQELGGEMAHLGQQGWELVAVIPIGDKHCMAFFKKPIA
jgi:hypothetical protein